MLKHLHSLLFTFTPFFIQNDFLKDNKYLFIYFLVWLLTYQFPWIVFWSFFLTFLKCFQALFWNANVNMKLNICLKAFSIMIWHLDFYKKKSKTILHAVMADKGRGKLLPLILLFSTLPIAQGKVLKGFQFLDNLLPDRFGPENGHADYIFDIPIPERVLACSWFDFHNWFFRCPFVSRFSLSLIGMVVKLDPLKSTD